MAQNKNERMDELIYQVFNTESGKDLLSLLVDDLVMVSAFHPDEKITYTNLGKQAFVLSLVEKSKQSPAEIRAKIDRFNKQQEV